MAQKLFVLIHLLAASLMCSAPGFSSYYPPPLSILLGNSELVAIGTISEVRSATFILNVELVVAGEESRSSVEIFRYQDWICSSRWQSYEVGQQVVVFAQKSDKQPADYALRSAGAEGEFPLVDGKIMIHGYAIRGLPEAALGSLPAYAVSKATFVDVVKIMRRCFRATPGAHPYAALRPICAEQDLDLMSARSALHQHIIGGARRHAEVMAANRQAAAKAAAGKDSQ